MSSLRMVPWAVPSASSMRAQGGSPAAGADSPKASVSSASASTSAVVQTLMVAEVLPPGTCNRPDAA